MIAKTDISEQSILVLSAANAVVLIAEFLTSVVLVILIWLGRAPTTGLVVCTGGLLLSGAHFACFVGLADAKIPALAKIGGLALLPLVSLALVALLFLGAA